MASTLERMLWCDSITPLGVPVLPLEKMTVARSSGVWRLSRRGESSRRAGESKALTAVDDFLERRRSLSRISSRKTMPSMASRLALARKIREVRMVRMPHCCDGRSHRFAPAVKFRFTGTLPARRTAMLASAPPTRGGQDHADHLSRAAQWLRSQRAQQQAADQASCRRSARCRWCRPCRIANQRRLAISMNLACKQIALVRGGIPPPSLSSSRMRCALAATVAVGGSGAPNETVTG